MSNLQWESKMSNWELASDWASVIRIIRKEKNLTVIPLRPQRILRIRSDLRTARTPYGLSGASKPLRNLRPQGTLMGG